MKLNSLDLEIKRSMMEYPDLFPSRLEVLENMFCTIGTGYNWNDEGRLSNRCDDEPDRPCPEHIRPAEAYMARITKSKVSTSEKIRMEYENTVRGFIEKNIDYLCQDIHHTNSRISFTNMYPISWGYSNMCRAADNPSAIDPDWISGIKELIHWYMPAVNGYYGVYSGEDNKPDTSRLDSRTLKNYETCKKVLEMLTTDFDRKVEERMKRDIDKMIHKMNKEDKKK